MTRAIRGLIRFAGRARRGDTHAEPEMRATLECAGLIFGYVGETKGGGG